MIFDSEITAFANENSIPQKYIPFFVEWVNEYSRNNEPEIDETIEDYNQSILDIGLDVIHRYIRSKDEGHSDLWSKVFAESEEDEDIAIREAYDEVRKHFNSGYEESTNNAVYIEAYNYCIKAGKTECYSKAYATFLAIEVNPIEEVRIYAEAVEEQIKKGNTELFAIKYAEHIIEFGGGIDNALYYADYYQHAINSGKDESYAEYFADNITSELANRINLNYKTEATVDHLLKFAEWKFKADARQYCQSAKIEDGERFISQYSTACFNEMFPKDDNIEANFVRDFAADEDFMKDVLINANVQLSDPMKQHIVAQIQGINYR